MGKANISLDNIVWYQQPVGWRQRVVDEADDLNALAWKVYRSNPGTFTSCLRNHKLREESRKKVQQQFKNRQIKVLEIGPGNRPSSLVILADRHGIDIDERFKRSYSHEPYEIADYFIKMGIDCQVDVMEIDPLSVELIRNQDHILIERFEGLLSKEPYRQLFGGMPRTRVLENQIELYNQNRDELEEERCLEAHLVAIPEAIRSRVNIFQGNIETDSIQHYDAIFFHAVDLYFNGDRGSVLRKISNALNPGGLLFTTEIENPQDYRLVEISRAKWQIDSACYQKT